MTIFSLIVSGHGEEWESLPFTSPYVRFGEYTDEALADTLDLDDPATLATLIEAPALLMYEVGADGPNVGVVRYGRVRNITRRGREVAFDFELDEEHGYLLRQDLLERWDELGISSFERYRTHWAVKKGELPPELIRKATPQLVQRTVQSVAEYYRRAVRRGDKREAQRCLQQIEEFPASVEKARTMVAPTLASRAVPELLAVTGLGEDADAKRDAVQAVLERNTGGTELPDDWAFSITWFLDEHGSPTEYRLVERYMEKCADRLRDLAQNPASIERVALILWKCARSRRIVGELRREIAMLMDLLVRTRNRDGFWKECLDSSPTPAVRTTALSTVVIQRLGDDRYHELLRANVQWLLGQVQAETGSLPRYADGTEPDLLATTFGLEALRRSDLAGELSHVLTRGDAWVVSAQTATGGWTGGTWDGDFVTATVLAYLARANDVLPQVDGFLLMARDFFRRGEDLRLEGGANNRRLSAIAVVHAVEMFLYGLFEKREDLGLSAYQDNGIETLGARKALGALQRALQRKGRLTENQRLPLRDQLSSLIGRRDGIIHRAHEISERELDTGIGHAREFIERQGDELLELNILE